MFFEKYLVWEKQRPVRGLVGGHGLARERVEARGQPLVEVVQVGGEQRATAHAVVQVLKMTKRTHQSMERDGMRQIVNDVDA